MRRIGRRRDAEEKMTIPPLDRRLGQAEPGLVHQHGGVEALHGPLTGQLGRSESAQLVVDLRQQVSG
jgi:hypothetical protein